MTSPLISCIVPVFNGERYLGEALDSIFGQTHRPLEVIVADDGSTDASAQVAAGYGGRVRYVRQANRGAAAARNLGVGAAEGEFLAFLDADDLWHPEKLARQMARFRARPELGFCVTHARQFWSPDLTEGAARSHERSLEPAVPAYIPGALLVRRAIFESVGQFSPALRHADDTDWFLRARERGVEAELLPEVLVYRRLHRMNMSRRFASDSRDEYLGLLKAALDRRRAPPAGPSGSPSPG